MQGGLDDSVGFRMDGTQTVSIHEQMTDFIAVRLTGG